MKKKKRIVQKKKRTAAIHITPIDVTTIETKDGKKLIKMNSESIHYEIGYQNEKGKLKFDFRSPNLISSWLDELQFDGHFCFVDTNRYPDPEPGVLAHITGWYIFRLAKLEINKNRHYTDVIWNTDYINSNIGLSVRPYEEGCSEKIGWQIAIDQMNAMGVKKAKIFVDKHQVDLHELSKELPDGWKYYYVSSDHGETWFNHIFRRLNNAITILARNNPLEYEKVDVEKYLMGNVKHLFKKDGSQG